ncbi:MAG: rod shape-determining protein MreC [Anaerolineae bacterium]
MLSNPRSSWLSYITMLVVLVLSLLASQLGYVQPLRDVARNLFVPLQVVMSSISQAVERSAGDLQNIQRLRQRMEWLQAEVNRLSVENVRLAEVEQENLRLRQLLNYTRNNPQYDYRTAAVVGQKIGENPSNLLFTIFIDVGVRDGVAPGMPVVTDRGLVGRIIRAGPNIAEVLLLIDPSSAVNARVLNSRVTGVVRGSVKSELIMERIPQGEVINPGDIIVTSGLGGTFPDKLVIGQVVEVSHRDADMFQTAYVRPAVDFSRIETVLVITTFKPLEIDASLSSETGGENTNP